mgnify:CR=1 FL=1
MDVAPSAAAGLWSASGPPKQNDAREARAQGKAARPTRNIVLLAPSVGFDPALPKLAGRYLQGATFSVAFDPLSTELPIPDFVARFQEAFGSNPVLFAAFAHDAYELVRATVDGGATTREAVAERLPQAKGAESVTPVRGFSSTREAASPTRVIELNGDMFEAP